MSHSASNGSTTLKRQIRVFLVENQCLVREGIKLLLQSNNISVVGDVTIDTANSLTSAVALAIEASPDIILVVPDENQHWFTIMRSLQDKLPETKYIVLTSIEKAEMHHQAVSAGADAVVLKSIAAKDLVNAIQAVSAGGAWLSPEIVGQILKELRSVSHEPVQESHKSSWDSPKHSYHLTEDEHARIARLTTREREVVSLIGEGLRNQQIADRLCISIITVRHHLSSVFAKLGVRDRFELAIYAYRHGLAKLPV